MTQDDPPVAGVHEVGAVLAQHRAVTGHEQLRCICGWCGRDLTPTTPYYDWTSYYEHVALAVLSLRTGEASRG